MRLLLVEDSNTYQQILIDIISDRFPLLELETANSVSQGKLLVNRFVPDIVFSDIRLNTGSGFEILKYVKAHNANTVVVMLTGFDLDEYRTAAKETGADYFIIKDTPIEDLLGFLADLLSPVESLQRSLLSDSFSLKNPYSKVTDNLECLKTVKSHSA